MDSKQKILIVDDKLENLFSMKQIMSDINIEIIAVASGNDALVASINHDFALAILDVQMPEMNGYELAEHLRSDEKTRTLPINFVSAVYSSDFHVFKGYDSGAVDFLVKPFEARILISKLNIFLELDRQKNQLALSNSRIEVQLDQLRISESRFSTLVNTVPDIVYRIDPGGCFTFVNEAISKLGYAPEDILNHHFSRIIWSNDIENISRDEILKQYQKEPWVLEEPVKLFDERRVGTRKTTGLETRLVPKNGVHVASLGQAAQICDDAVVVEINSAGFYSDNTESRDKTFLGTVGVIRDITVRKNLEENLKQANERLEAKVKQRTTELVSKNVVLQREVEKRKKAERKIRKAKKEWKDIFEAIGHMTMIMDKDHRILKANKAIFEEFSLNERTIIGKRCYEVFHHSGSPHHKCPMENALTTKCVEASEITFENGDKSYIVSCTPVYNGKGKLQKIIHIATDITQRKQLEKELIQAHKMEAIGTLAGGIAHDFNNILASLIGFAELSLMEAEKGSALEDDIKEILNAGDRAKDLVSQILTFARRSDDEVMPLRVDLIVKEVLKFIRSTIPSSIKIKHNIQSKAKVLGNATQIHQVLMNLCSNAAYAMKKEGGQLSVNLDEIQNGGKKAPVADNLGDGPYLKLEISDTGEGIPKGIIDQIFEPYFTTKEAGVGTGMGLAVVSSIIKDAGGTIQVQSEFGEGTFFTLYLPVTRDQVIPKKSELKKIKQSSGEHLLFVDDEKLITRMVKQSLEKIGYNVSVFTRPQKAINAFKKTPHLFDVIISDLTMPAMTGDRLLEKIKEINPDIPFILCSGYTGKYSTSVRGLPKVDAFIKKPFDIQQFIRTIQTVIDNNKHDT